MPAWWRAAPASSPAMLCRGSRTDAGGAIGREALDAGRGASGAGIKPGEALPREALDAADVLLNVPRRVLSWPARTDGVFWDRELSITGPNR
jgi:hypothetical protein